MNTETYTPQRDAAAASDPAPIGSGYVGRSIKRVEDPRLMSGQASYVDDMRLPGMLHMALLRSPFAHARIVSINAEAARAMPGVVAVLTGADINAACGSVPCASSIEGLRRPEHTVLAGDRVYFAGHPVAVVVARDRYLAADALQAVEIEYDPLPVVTDPEQALLPDAPRTHPEFPDNTAFQSVHATGDIEEAFRKADRVVACRFVHQRLTPMAIEPRACIAQYHRGDQQLTLWSSTQVPHFLRTLLPAMIGVPENRLRIVAPEVGGAFGSKLNLYAEEAICCHLAMRLNAAVKWIESRRENAACTTHGRDQIGEYEVAVRNDGTLLGIKARVVADLGAYLQLLTPSIPFFTALMTAGCYHMDAVHVQLHGVFTHKMATDAYRGAGRPEAAYAIERLMDLIADELGLDPIAVRRRNFPSPDAFPFPSAGGLTYDSGQYDRALSEAQRLADWNTLLARRAQNRREGRLYGIGVGTYVEMCAVGPSAYMPAGGWEWGSVRVDIAGKVTVVTGATYHGQGQETSFAQIVADRLSVKMEDIVVLRGDTNVAPHGRDTYGSRTTALGGSALVLCTDKILHKARRLAAHLLEADAEAVTYAEGAFRDGASGRTLGWAEVAAAAYVAKRLPPNMEPGLEASSFFEPENFTFPFGAHIAAVEIDPETGQVTIDRYICVDDCGPQINPLLVEGQVQGGIAQGLGQALFEQTVYDEYGQLLTGEFLDYAMPRAADIPAYTMGSTVTPSTCNPLGIKGVGEAGTIGATPTIANAVMDALQPYGVRHIDLPLTPEKIWRALRDRAPDERAGSVRYQEVRF